MKVIVSTQPLQELEVENSPEAVISLALESGKSLFINATAHRLLEAQLREAEKALDSVIVNFKDLNPELFSKLTNIQGEDFYELKQYADQFFDTINSFTDRIQTYVHLPIGSPDFQFELYSRWIQETNAVPVFSRTERKVVEVEVDGKVEKKSTFEFKGFVVKSSDRGFNLNL